MTHHNNITILHIEMGNISPLGPDEKESIGNNLEKLLEESTNTFLPNCKAWNDIPEGKQPDIFPLRSKIRKHDGQYEYRYFFSESDVKLAIKFCLLIKDNLSEYNNSEDGKDNVIRLKLILSIGDINWIGDQLTGDILKKSNKIINSSVINNALYNSLDFAVMGMSHSFHSYCHYLNFIHDDNSLIFDSFNFLFDLNSDSEDAYLVCFDSIPDEMHLKYYALSIAEKFRSTRLLKKTLNIDEQYFPIKIKTDTEQVEDAVTHILSEDTKRICLVGPSGSGKTAIIRRIIWELRDGDKLPFVIFLRDFSTPALHSTLHHIPIEWFFSSIGQYCLNSSTNMALFELINKGRGVFIIDGFDELRGDIKWAEHVTKDIKSFFLNKQGCKVIITTRTIDDLHGHFRDFSFCNLEPIDPESINDFCNTVDTASTERSNTLGELMDLGLIEKRPVLLIFAMLLLDMKDKKDSIKSTFHLLDVTLKEILQDEYRDVNRERHKFISNIQKKRNIVGDDICNIRLNILEKIVSNWENSATPCITNEYNIKGYLSSALKEIKNDSDPIKDEEMPFFIPTGICLEIKGSTTDTKYGFVHNSLQDFFYAKLLKREIANNKYDLLNREYYYYEVLKLLGESLEGKDIHTLMDWMQNDKMPLMVRKVGIGILGFLNPDENIIVKDKLKAAFETETDIGIAGRMAEALRRLGNAEAIERFVNKLDKYPERNPDDDPENIVARIMRPLTYEIDRPIEGFEDYKPQLYNYLENSKSAIARKHALILLMRIDKNIPLINIIKHCSNELSAIEYNSKKNKLKNDIVDPSRSLSYGLQVLKKYGTCIEIDMCNQFINRIEDIFRNPNFNSIYIHFRNIIDEIKIAIKDKNPEAFIQKIPYKPHLFLIRHAESEANKMDSFLGKTPEGGLSECGAKQARRMADALRGLLENGKFIAVSGDSERAKETLESLGAHFEFAPETDKDFNELDFGHWTGRTKTKIKETEKKFFQSWVKDPKNISPPGGESLLEVRSRVFAAFYKWLERAAREEKDVVIVTHYFPLKVLYEGLLEEGPKVDQPINTAITELHYGTENWEIQQLNDCSHLPANGFEKVTW